MLTLGPLTFLSPVVLLAAAVLPLVWLLLRLTPPALRRLTFPAARLLFDLPPTERTSARTPPWLMVLRIGLLLLAIVGLANPVLTSHRAETGAPVIVVMDDGWAAATQWDQRMKALRNVLETAERHGQRAALVTTAPGDMSTVTPKMMPAREVLARASLLKPQPWPVDRAAAARRLRDLAGAQQTDQRADVVWISDTVAAGSDDAFNTALQALGPITIIAPDAEAAPVILTPPRRMDDADTPDRIDLAVRRVADDAPEAAYAVRALDKDDHVLARTAVTLAPGNAIGHVAFDAPPELSNRITRFDVEGHGSAAATVLADAHWQRRPVGIASTTANGISAPLLEDAFYIRQALVASADVREGDLNDLLSRPLAVLFMAGGGKILDNEVPRVTAWVDGGGVLVRFAGPRLEGNVDPLLPVPLRAGGRTFGGALSWDEPAHLAPFGDTSPFRNLDIPNDVTIATQVLAEPSSDLPARTWARLSDGTPLVTAVRHGQGWIVLFHVTASPEWSNLPLSGLFVDMLRRVVDMSAGVAVPAAGGSAAAVLPPVQLLDGFGHLVAPSPTTRSLTMDNIGKIGPQQPAGLYGTAGNTTALNLSPDLTDATPIRAWPTGAQHLSFGGVARERALKPYFVGAALLLLLLDLVISFLLRGLAPVIPRRNATAAVLLAMLASIAHGTAHAADARPLDPAAVAAILDTRLAYVVTGDTRIDHTAAAGLSALTHVLAMRTSAEMAEPTALDLGATTLTADSLSPYPLIYWRVSPGQGVPTAQAVAALSAYLHRGGLVVFDAPEQAGALGGHGAGAKLDGILQAMDLPRLIVMRNDHVLTRSFYLLKGLPGRFTDSTIYVDRGTTSTDGVSSVIVGGNDWAAAWARDDNGLPLYPVVPGGESQREMAYRAGVNMVMYALTGNYKSDQVHLPAIMQRLTQ